MFLTKQQNYMPRQCFFILLHLILVSGSGYTASVAFTPRELFRVPFGAQRGALGARVADGNFSFPRDFTLDDAGHFYIYDIHKHRIARYSSQGQFEIGFNYPDTASQTFAHTDSRQNLWLLISDPGRGIYYGVYNPRGKRLREGIFSQYSRFRLHLDDDHLLHIILSARHRPGTPSFIFDEVSLLMKKENIGPPPEDHHQILKGNRRFYIDAVPGASRDASRRVNRVTNEAHRGVAEIPGAVLYITDAGEVYTRRGDCEVDVYEADGAFKGKVALTGLASVCSAIRFDSDGNIYELDGIPDAANHYTPDMPGMRVLVWERR